MSKRIDRIKAILVYLVIVFLPVMSIVNVFGKVKINMALSDAFAALIVILTLIDYKNFSLRRNFPYWWYFTGLMGLMIVSNILAYFNPGIVAGGIFSTVNEFVKFGIAGVYFFIGYNCLDDKAKLAQVLKVWIYTALAVSIIGIVILFNSDIGLAVHPEIPINVLRQRFVGTLTDPNLSATYLGISFYISILFISNTTKKIDRYIGVISLIIIAAALALTQSRSGIIAFVVSFILYGAINIKKIYRYITVVLLIGIIGYFGVLNIDAVYLDKQISFSMDARMEEVFEGKGQVISRSNLSKAAFMMGKNHYLIGVGRGNYTLNSEQYYRELDIDITTDYYKGYFSKLIPHNTYMSFFAELGIPGLVLFLVLFYKAIKQNFRFKYDSTLILCLLSFFLIQAIAVNLENFRGIWFILGIALLYSGKYEISCSTKEEYKLPGISSKKILTLNIVLLLLGIFVFLNTVPYYSNPVLLEKGLKPQDITDFKPTEQYVLRYLIKTETQNISKPSAKISIYGIDKDNRKTLINEIRHYAPNGYGSLVFVPDGNIRTVRIEAEPLDTGNTVVSLSEAAVINTHTGVGERVFTEYRYIPDSIENYINSIGLIRRAVKVDTASLDLFADKKIENEIPPKYAASVDSLFFNGSNAINISDKVLLLGAKLSGEYDGQVELSLIFKCIGKMDVDYRIWMHGETIDEGILSEERQKYGFENWDHKFEVSTAEWQVGKTYEHTYIIHAAEGQYDLSFGFWDPNPKDGKSYSLKPGIELGNIQIK